MRVSLCSIKMLRSDMFYRKVNEKSQITVKKLDVKNSCAEN